VRAIERLRGGGASLRANLGIGQGVSNLELVRAVEDATGTAVRCRLGARRPGDPAVLVSDAALARRELGWEPRYREIASIVRTAVEGYARAMRSAPV